MFYLLALPSSLPSSWQAAIMFPAQHIVFNAGDPRASYKPPSEGLYNSTDILQCTENNASFIFDPTTLLLYTPKLPEGAGYQRLKKAIIGAAINTCKNDLVANGSDKWRASRVLYKKYKFACSKCNFSKVVPQEKFDLKLSIMNNVRKNDAKDFCPPYKLKVANGSKSLLQIQIPCI